MDEFKDFTDDFVVVDAVPGESLLRCDSAVVDFCFVRGNVMSCRVTMSVGCRC